MAKVVLTLRLTPELHGWLEGCVEKSGRSINAEIVSHIETIRRGKLLSDALDKQADKIIGAMRS